MDLFKKILSEITGYSIDELEARRAEAILQPYDCFMALIVYMEKTKKAKYMKKFKLFVDFLFILTVIYMCIWIKPNVNNTLFIGQNLSKMVTPKVLENHSIINYIA